MKTWLTIAISIGTCVLGASACSGDREGDAGGFGAASGVPVSAETNQQCVDLINQYRASAGLPAYARWSRAEECAAQQAQSDAASGRAHGAFGECDERAQNECPGWSGPPADMIGGCLEMMMSEGPGGGHYDSIMSSRYSEVACGFYTLPNGEVWSVQDFR